MFHRYTLNLDCNLWFINVKVRFSCAVLQIVILKYNLYMSQMNDLVIIVVIIKFSILSNQWSDGFQVQLINLISEGNNTLLRLAIFPAGSASYFSNATAMVG